MESAGRNASRFQFRCSETTLKGLHNFQNGSSSIGNCQKPSCHSSATSSHEVKSIKNGLVG